MANLRLPSPNGWNKWDLSRNRNTISDVIYPDIPFSPLYTPAGEFWLRSIAANCQINWLVTFDFYTLFIVGGGGAPSVIGSLGGIFQVKNALSLPGILDFGLGRDGVGPRLGYTIGDSFKQQAYIRLFSTSLVPSVIASDFAALEHYIELLQNSRFKQLIIKQGKIFNYKKIQDRYIIDVGIKNDTSSGVMHSNNVNGIIHIVNSGGVEFEADIEGFDDDWNLILNTSDGSDDFDISLNSFYNTDIPICVEDPFLMSGFWKGPENDSPSGITSGFNLYETTHNTPYKEGQFTGIYFIKDNDNEDNDNEDNDNEDNDNEDNDNEDNDNEDNDNVKRFVSNIPIKNNGNLKWYFYGFGNSNEESKYYNDDNRYIEVINFGRTTTESTNDLENDSDNMVVSYAVMPSGTEEDLSLLYDLEPDFIRVEIGNGSDQYSHNWYAPCLKGQYIYNDNTYFEIIAHPQAMVLDVSYKDVYQQKIFNPNENRNYSILNTKAWMISEHYDGDPDTAVDSSTTNVQGALGLADTDVISTKHKGIFSGRVSDIAISYDNGSTISNVVINTVGDSFVSWYKYPGYNPPDIDNNFISRYKNTHVHLSSEPIKAYSKYARWKLVFKSDQTEYSIKNVIFSSDIPTNISEPYSVKLEIEGGLEEDLINREVYITFSEGLDTISPFNRENYNYFLTARPNLKNESLFGHFIQYDSICIDAEFFSPPYSLDIPTNTRIGCCEGYLFGVDVDNTASSPIGMWLLTTTKRQIRGLASLFNAIVDEDWVMYNDVKTKNLTLRRGSLGFKDLPQKTEVFLGQPEAVEPFNGIINSNYDRINKIKIQNPSLEDYGSIAFMISFNNIDNTYGFVVSGDGIVDLQMLRLQGIGSGVIDSSKYSDDEGKVISPVYKYKNQSNKSFLPYITIDIGANTTDNESVILWEETDPENTNTRSVLPINNALVEYINDNQTLSNIALFDVVKISDGEAFIIYGQKTDEFSLWDEDDYKPNNGAEGSSTWSNPSSVFIIGSYNEAHYWGAPTVVKQSSHSAKPYPVMLINSVEYLGLIYDRLSNRLNVFCRCFKDKRQYIGMFSVSTLTLSNSLYDCRDSEGNIKFLWRPPVFSEDFLQNEDASYTDTKNLVNDFFSFDGEVENVTDEFVRVMGTPYTNSSVSYSGEFGIISTNMLSDGTYVLFFDSEIGIRAIYSINKGRSWMESGLTYARDGRNGLLIDKCLFYITEDGIKFKIIDEARFQDDKTISQRKLAGKNTSVLEINKQEELDDIQSNYIGSGPIPFQRLSGYKTSDGILKVFYYNNNDILVCMESKNARTWNVASNF